jgi:hypothetical protein
MRGGSGTSEDVVGNHEGFSAVPAGLIKQYNSPMHAPSDRMSEPVRIAPIWCRGARARADFASPASLGVPRRVNHLDFFTGIGVLSLIGDHIDHGAPDALL